MKIKMDYGKEGVYFELPDNSDILLPNHKKKLSDPVSKIIESLENPIDSLPLGALYKKGMKVGVSVCDHTRAQPRNEIINSLLKTFDGIRKEDLIIFIATGSHRATTKEEINEIFNTEIISNTTIIIHDSEDSSNLKNLGKTSKKTPILINKEWISCDLRITTGFVEPHFFAGFSGGPKMTAPGLAGIETIMNLHDYDRINNHKSSWGIIEGNPIHEEISEISRVLKPDFSVDLTLNRENHITGIFSGDLFSEHSIACNEVRKDSMIETK